MPEGTGLIVLHDSSSRKLDLKSGKSSLGLRQRNREETGPIRTERRWGLALECLLNAREAGEVGSLLPGKALSGTSRADVLICFLMIVFICIWLSWVLGAAGLFPSCGAQASHCGPLLLWSTGSKAQGLSSCCSWSLLVWLPGS